VSRSGPSYQGDQLCSEDMPDLNPSGLMVESGAEKSEESGRNEAQELDVTRLKAH
jgi:hypothetical protein